MREGLKVYEPVREEDGGVKTELVEVPITLIHVVNFKPGGGKAEPGDVVRQNNAMVYVPGISPFAIRRVEFDPVDYGDIGCPRRARVMVTYFEGDEHLAPETVEFKTLAEFEAHYAKT